MFYDLPTQMLYFGPALHIGLLSAKRSLPAGLPSAKLAKLRGQASANSGHASSSQVL